MKNLNSNITIRELTLSDIYDGIIVQSCGNTNHIYELKVNSYGEILYKTRYKIGDEHSLEVPSITEVKARSFGKSTLNEWCETIYSREFNKDYIRESKINILLS